MTVATRRCPDERHLVPWATNTAVTRASSRGRRGRVSLRGAGMRSPCGRPMRMQKIHELPEATQVGRHGGGGDAVANRARTRTPPPEDDVEHGRERRPFESHVGTWKTPTTSSPIAQLEAKPAAMKKTVAAATGTSRTWQRRRPTDATLRAIPNG